MKLLLLLISGLILAAATAEAAGGCPPGTRQECAQAKGKVICTCNR